MKNFREWKFPWVTCVISFAFVGVLYLIHGVQAIVYEHDLQLHELRIFDQVLVGQKKVDVLSDPIAKQLAQDLIDARHSDDALVVKRAEDRIADEVLMQKTTSRSDDARLHRERKYVAQNVERARLLAGRGGGVEELITPVPAPAQISSYEPPKKLILILLIFPVIFYLLKLLLFIKDSFRRKKLEEKYTPRYKKAVEDTRYRAPALDDEMSPGSLRGANEARLIRSDPGEVDELISLQPAPSISKTAAGQ
ncbi:MAG: hypothetical protein WC766_01780 [Patescibacteria group bacterium]|jgi:hypothetical protein